MMKVDDFVFMLIKAATQYNTLYVMGCIGAPINKSTAKRYIDAYSYNRTEEREKMINDAIDTNCFGFDCICLIKTILWGWKADFSHQYGGAVYQSNGVSDITLDSMLEKCTNVSDDFSSMKIGEYLWTTGHCGIYIGGGLAVECTPKWENGVQITAVENIGKVDGYNSRIWKKHGILPYLEYSENESYHPLDKDQNYNSTKKGYVKNTLSVITKLSESLYNSI